MTYVLSDIHGNLQRFKSIMAQINLQTNDTLYVLGDVIDRYAEGIKILRQIMRMPNISFDSIMYLYQLKIAHLTMGDF